MTTNQQERQLVESQEQKYSSRKSLLELRIVVIIVGLVIIAVAAVAFWFFRSQSITQTSIILPIIIGVVTLITGLLGIMLSYFQWRFPTTPHPSRSDSTPELSPSISASNAQAVTQLPPASSLLSPHTSTHRGIIGLPPPTDPRTIQQRESAVRDIYAKLIQLDITAIALTGIGGVGKSTLAALIYRYAEEQRQIHSAQLSIEAIWLTIDQAVSFADLAGNLHKAVGKPLPDLSSLSPHSQAVSLFNALNATDRPRLIVLDQFENLLDWNTGHALPDRPGVGEWLDIINSQQCACRILLTSRPRPVGLREYPPTFLQEYAVGGLTVNEGVALLRNQGVQGTELELQAAVTHCAGHAFALSLLATLLRDHHLSLSALFNSSMLWAGDIATNLLDQIYKEQLSNIQRDLLRAFSIYREPVPLEATKGVISQVAKGELSSALKALRVQHLLEAAGEGRYQLHTIIAEYAQDHFDENDEQANAQALRAAHAKAAQYYLQQSAIHCPPQNRWHQKSDVHDLIEAIWQYCQAEQWQKAYNLMREEELFTHLSRWGENATLLELYHLLSVEKWQPEDVYRAYICINLGEVNRVVGRMERALTYLEQGLFLCQKTGDRTGEARALTYLGRAYNPLGNKKRARAYYERALTILREVGDRTGEALLVNNLGWIYFDLGQLRRALEYYEQGLSIYQEVGDRNGEAPTLYSIGNVYQHLGQSEQALDYFIQALNTCREVGDRGWESATLSDLGRIYNAMGEWESALRCCEEALTISREIGDRGGEGWNLYHLGCIYQTSEKKEQAIDLCEQSLGILKEIGDRRGEAKVLIRLGSMYWHFGERKRASACCRQGLTILREVEDRWGEGETLYTLGKLHYENDRFGPALACFILAKDIMTEVQSPSSDEVQSWIDTLHNRIGNESFTLLLSEIEPQASQVVEQSLHQEVEA